MEKFEVVEELGTGSFGVALLCIRIADGEHCVVKKIKLRELSKRDAMVTGPMPLLPRVLLLVAAVLQLLLPQLARTAHSSSPLSTGGPEGGGGDAAGAASVHHRVRGQLRRQ